MGKTNLGRVTFVPKGFYNKYNEYHRLEVVENRGNSYVFLQDSIGIEPAGDNVVTMLLARKGKDFTYDDFTTEQLAELKGEKGEIGKGLTILGYYDTLDSLKALVANPEIGDAYGVGTEIPYEIHVFDGVTNDWVNNGTLSGGGQVDKESVERALIGNIVTHSHDTVEQEPICDILNIETAETDIQDLIGDGSVFPLSGSGTLFDPYIIDSAIKWLLFYSEVANQNSSDTKKYYKLTVNCDLAGFEIPVFDAKTDETAIILYSLDGDGHFIRNFTITGTNKIVSLFPILGIYDKSIGGLTTGCSKVDAQIKNIGFKDATYKLTCNTDLGNGQAGITGICSICANNSGSFPEISAIQNCYLDNIQFDIDNSYSLQNSSGAMIFVSSFCGGFVFDNVKNCYAKGLKVNVTNVDSAPITYFPFGYIFYSSDYSLFDNIYIDVTIESNKEIVQDLLPSLNNGTFNKCFIRSNLNSTYIPTGVEVITLEILKSTELSEALGNLFAFDSLKNDGYPYLISQRLKEITYDGYVRRSEIDKLLNSSPQLSYSDFYKIPSAILSLDDTSTSAQISNAIGGIAGFNAIKEAILNYKRIILPLNEGEMKGCFESVAKAYLKGRENEIMMESCYIVCFNVGINIIHNLSDDTFMFQNMTN